MRCPKCNSVLCDHVSDAWCRRIRDCPSSGGQEAGQMKCYDCRYLEKESLYCRKLKHLLANGSGMEFHSKMCGEPELLSEETHDRMVAKAMVKGGAKDGH